MSGTGSAGGAWGAVSSTCPSSRLSTVTAPATAPVSWPKGPCLAAAMEPPAGADYAVPDLDLDRPRGQPQQLAGHIVQHVEADLVVGQQ
jgi:hypothetical protein